MEDGFTFDFAGHIMFSNDPYVHQMYRMLLGDNCHWQDREAWVYSHGVHTRYPFQGALYGLPPDVIRECIMGAIEARFGTTDSQKSSKATEPNSLNVSQKPSTLVSQTTTELERVKGPRCDPSKMRIDEKLFGDVKDCCGDGVLESTATLVRGLLGAPPDGNGHSKVNGHSNGKIDTLEQSNGNATKQPANFEEFIYQVWGRGIAKHFAIPYNQKLWAVPLSEMETSWLGGRVPQPNLEEMIDGALQPVAKPQGPNARFGYPLRGGFQALMGHFSLITTTQDAWHRKKV